VALVPGELPPLAPEERSNMEKAVAAVLASVLLMAALVVRIAFLQASHVAMMLFVAGLAHGGILVVIPRGGS
jgi:hypothetical protein